MSESALDQAWAKFAAFQVLADHEPMSGFRLVMQVAPEPGQLAGLLEHRAPSSAPLDPDLAQIVVRAGLGLVRTGFCSFVYAMPEQVLVLVREDAVAASGASVRVHDLMVSGFASRLSLLAGTEVPAVGRIYEFPDLGVARRAFRSVRKAVEDAEPARAVRRVAAQARGQGRPLPLTAVDDPEQHAATLLEAGVVLDRLPPWWRHGVAARRTKSGEPEILDGLPQGDVFGALVRDP